MRMAQVGVPWIGVASIGVACRMRRGSPPPTPRPVAAGVASSQWGQASVAMRTIVSKKRTPIVMRSSAKS